MTLNKEKHYVVHVKVLFIPSGCFFLSPNVNLCILKDHYIKKIVHFVLYVHLQALHLINKKKLLELNVN